MAWTLANFRTAVEAELDLEDEDFITTAEFTRFVNMAISEAESEIHKLGLEDEYFRSSADLGLTSGTGAYALPSDIYASKILSIQYDSSEKQYEILRIRGVKALAEYHYLRRYGSTTCYKYLLSNVAGTGVRVQLAPISGETNSYATVWYIRNAKQLSAEADVCDIPFHNFILQYVRDKCLNKERMTMDAPPSPALEQQRKLMIETLSEQVPDGHNEIEYDSTHYEEST